MRDWVKAVNINFPLIYNLVLIMSTTLSHIVSNICSRFTNLHFKFMSTSAVNCSAVYSERMSAFELVI